MKSHTWYALLVLGVVILAVAGYGGYVLFPRFELPAVSGVSLFVLAAAAGIGSFFSPCSFPLLVTLLARETGVERSNGDHVALPRTLRFAAALALGASAFLLLAGAGVAAGGGPLFARVTFTSTAGRILRIVVGLLLILLGLVQLRLLPFSLGQVARLIRPLRRAEIGLRSERPTTAFALFGFGYILAGFG